MRFDYIEHKENLNIIPCTIQNKKEYYLDLGNIEESFSGTFEFMFSNKFFLESSQLIVNAITLYEKGYFDCAFYSLRQSLEISTTIVYLVDDNDENRKNEFSNWKYEKRFPQQGEMLRTLNQRKKVFAEMKEKMHLFFDELEKTKRKLNKYVHKQGYDKFYTYRNNRLGKEFDDKLMLKDFECSLLKCIGAIAVFRLAIDPLPLLLNDIEIYNRTVPLMSDSYSDDFLDKYIGRHHIKSYKETELYKSHYDYFIQQEEMTPAVVDLVKNDFYDKDKRQEILKQRHLLNNDQLFVIEIFEFSEKIAFIYCYSGLQMYFSNIKSKRVHQSLNTQIFKDLSESPQRFNIRYDEAYLTCIEKLNNFYYIEHNEEFSESEIRSLDLLATEELVQNK